MKYLLDNCLIFYQLVRKFKGFERNWLLGLHNLEELSIYSLCHPISSTYKNDTLVFEDVLGKKILILSYQVLNINLFFWVSSRLCYSQNDFPIFLQFLPLLFEIKIQIFILNSEISIINKQLQVKFRNLSLVFQDILSE